MTPSTYILAILMLNAVYAAPQLERKPDEVVILEQENNFNGVDPWRWSYRTSDGQSHEESGALTADGKSVTLQGSYSWTSPEGITFTVTYTADDDLGFVPKVTQQGAGAPPPRGGAGGAPGALSAPGFAARPRLSPNSQLSLVGRRK